MRASKPLTVTLTKQLAARVKARVKSGEYASESEVIREGLRALEDQEEAVKHWLQTEARKRLKEHEADPDNVISAAAMRAKLRAHIAKRRATRK
jgi:putative addiction module CopG family antidote